MDYSNNSLRAAIRALETVVRPVVATASDAQAQDQLGLVIDALRFLEQRLPDLPARAAFSTRLILLLAGDLADLVGTAEPGRAAALRSVRRDDDAAAAVRELLRHWPSLAGDQLRREVARLVLASERRRVEADRAWFAPLGFDPVPDTILSLAEVWA